MNGVMINNGRVSLDASSPPPAPFQMFAAQVHTSTGRDDRGEATGGGTEYRGTLKNIDCSEVSELFFSKRNVDAVQDAIRYRVWVDTQRRHLIGRQSEEELHMIMRALYLQYGNNDPYDITHQVRVLNTRVLDYCVPTIVSEIDMYMQYRQDIQQLPIPLERGEYATNKGSRVLEMWNGV